MPIRKYRLSTKQDCPKTSHNLFYYPIFNKKVFRQFIIMDFLKIAKLLIKNNPLSKNPIQTIFMSLLIHRLSNNSKKTPFN